MAMGLPVTVALAGDSRVVPRSARASPYTVYRVEVMPLGVPALGWTVFRRYSEFRSLRTRLADAGVTLRSPFPNKLSGFMGAHGRQIGLNRWLSELAAMDLRSETVLAFLCRDADAVPPGTEGAQRPSRGRKTPLGGYATARLARDALAEAFRATDRDGRCPGVSDVVALGSTGAPVRLGTPVAAPPAGPPGHRASKSALAAMSGSERVVPPGLTVDTGEPDLRGAGAVPGRTWGVRPDRAASPPGSSGSGSARSGARFFLSALGAGGSSTRSVATEGPASAKTSHRALGAVPFDGAASGSDSRSGAESAMGSAEGGSRGHSARLPRSDDGGAAAARGASSGPSGSTGAAGAADAGSCTPGVDLSEAEPDVATTVGAQKAASAPPPAARVTMESFETLKLLGRGGFARVVLVRHRATRRVYAMKILDKRAVLERRQREHTLTERSVLGFVRHPFIVGLSFAFQSPRSLYLVLDYCSGGELFFHLQKRRRFNEATTRFYTAQLVVALSFLHERGVVYRDLKPENILIGADGYIKLADFGLSKEGVKATHGSHSFCGTPEYLAPEIIEKRGHGTAVDWWSLGMLVFEMLTGLPPWYTTSRPKLYDRLCKAELRFDEGAAASVSPEAQSLIRGFLNRDPARRLGSGRSGTKDIVSHPFFGDASYFMALLDKRVPPPICPSLPAGETDTSNFSAEFTAAPVPGGSPVAEEDGTPSDGLAGSAPPGLRHSLSGGSDAMHYAGFTFQRSPELPGGIAAPEADADEGSTPGPADASDGGGLELLEEPTPEGPAGAPGGGASLRAPALGGRAGSGVAGLVQAARMVSPSSDDRPGARRG